ncbi:MAG: trypsin-like peptidase domain-containing protein, partial [Gemmatimonadetes bacterium]|nr:trypsin-like peptidase domain-containing protein [Gemmatimonadota bacterium]
MRAPCLAFCTALCLGIAPGMAVAQPPSVATSDVFQRYADRVVKIQVVETGSAAKSGIGSGFFVSADGQLVTNYHVIAELIQSPGRYRAEYLDAQGQTHAAEVLGVDVISDLAVLSTTSRPGRFFEIGTGAV